MNSFKLGLKKEPRLMETISYIKGLCNNLNRRTEDFIFDRKWFCKKKYLFIRLIFKFDYLLIIVY